MKEQEQAGFHYSLGYALSSVAMVVVVVLLFWLFPYRPEMVEDTAAENTNLPVIVIDAGHGGEDCGAIGANGVYEKDLNLQMAFRLASLFRAAGYPVVLTRTEDKLLYTEEQNIRGQRKFYDLKNRLDIAQSCENAVFISIHMNSFPSSRYWGTQIWYGKAESSQTLAQAVQSEVVRVLQPESRRQVKEATDDLYLAFRCDHPTLLVECGFLSNEAECAKLMTEEYQKELSFVIFYAMIEAMNTQTQEY